MKFGKKILTVSHQDENLCSASQWMDYKKLKKLIKDCEAHNKKRGNQEGGSEDRKEIKSSASETAFFKLLLFELNKVSKSFRQMENSVLQEFLLFVPEVEKLKSLKNPSETQINNCLNECAEHHLRFVLLENYAVMNYCGFTKILKKHDKNTGFKTREKYMIKMVNEQPFAYHKKIQFATTLILKEFHLLKALKSKFKLKSDALRTQPKDKGGITDVPQGRVLPKSNNIVTVSQRALHVKRMSENALVSNGFAIGNRALDTTIKTAEEIEDEKRKNRLDDLVSLLEKHQEELKRNSQSNKRPNDEASGQPQKKMSKHR